MCNFSFHWTDFFFFFFLTSHSTHPCAFHFQNQPLVPPTVSHSKMSTKQLLKFDLLRLYLSSDSFLLHSNTPLSILFPPFSPRDWIQGLSTYATSSFLRAAELGAEIGELWLQENAAVYLWNYSSKLLAGAKYQWLLPAFQSLVEVLQKAEYTG